MQAADDQDFAHVGREQRGLCPFESQGKAKQTFKGQGIDPQLVDPKLL